MSTKNHNKKVPRYLLPTRSSATRSSITSEEIRKRRKKGSLKLPQQSTEKGHLYHYASAKSKGRDDATFDLKSKENKRQSEVSHEFRQRQVYVQMYAPEENHPGGISQYLETVESRFHSNLQSDDKRTLGKEHTGNLAHQSNDVFMVPGNLVQSQQSLRNINSHKTNFPPNENENKRNFDVSQEFGQRRGCVQMSEPVENINDENSQFLGTVQSQSFTAWQSDIDKRTAGKEHSNNVAHQSSLHVGTIEAPGQWVADTDTGMKVDRNIEVNQDLRPAETSTTCVLTRRIPENGHNADGKKKGTLDLDTWTGTRLNQNNTRIKYDSDDDEDKRPYERNNRRQQYDDYDRDDAPLQRKTGSYRNQRDSTRLPYDDDRREEHAPVERNHRSQRNQPEEYQMRELTRNQVRNEDIEKRSLNLKFYRNEMKSKPWGYKIEDMLAWRGDYNKLEGNHSYIQWLFPTREYSNFNSYAQPMEFHEAEEIRETPELNMRFLRAYTMMLDFYGMELKSEDTGEVQRCQKNYRERFKHLNRSHHNCYRITRIIIALGIFGYEHFQAPWVMFMLNERFKHKTLSDIPVGVLHRWMESVNNDQHRNNVMIEFTMLSENTDIKQQKRGLSRASSRAKDKASEHKDKPKLKDMVRAPNAHRDQDVRTHMSFEGSDPGFSGDGHYNEQIGQHQMSAQDRGRHTENNQVDIGSSVIAGYNNAHNETPPELAYSGYRDYEGDVKVAQSPAAGDLDKVIDDLSDCMGSMTVQEKNNKQGSVRSAKDIALEDTSDLGTEKTPNQDEKEQETDLRMPGRSDSTGSDKNNDDDVSKPSNKTDMMCSNQQSKGEDDGRSVILKFYKNEVASEPSGSKIDAMLKWKGDYTTLEMNHFYIPWLFPTGESSNTNSYAEPIQHHEAEKIRADPELKKRFLRAYTMMLDFYGMELMSEKTGEVQRCQKNFRERFENLNRSKHNWLRITRILTALGIFGFEHYQAPWVSFMMQEIYVHQTLPGIDINALQHWIDAVTKDDDKTTLDIQLVEFATNSN